jgi:hypothetical protein
VPLEGERGDAGVPAPQNGSRTMPPGLQPALMQRVGRSIG